MAGASATLVATTRPQAADPASGPCPSILDTRLVSDDALTLPVALREQEFSQWRFQYTIRVARMVALRDTPVLPHFSGGFGFIYLLHFASCVPKIGPWQEFKEGVKQ